MISVCATAATTVYIVKSIVTYSQKSLKSKNQSKLFFYFSKRGIFKSIKYQYSENITLLGNLTFVF